MWRMCCLGLAMLLTMSARADCPPQGTSRAEWLALRAAQFKVEPEARRERLAIALLDCLGNADPRLRDGVAFEALSHWLREDALPARTRGEILQSLLPRLEAADPQGFEKPFAVLVLSEVVRTDRIAPWMSAAERAVLVEAAARYLAGVRDYRAFDTVEGWRHGVAHGADLALQLVLTPAIDRSQVDLLLDSIALQIAPAGETVWTHGESARLARPVLYAASRGLHDESFWKAWFDRVALPAPLPGWEDAFGNATGLARRHNVRMFLLEVYAASREAEEASIAALAPAASGALSQVP